MEPHDLEERSLAHAGPDGHVCGREHGLTVAARTILRTVEPDGATDVFVFPDETYVLMADHVARYRNSPEMIETLDHYLLTGELPQVGYVYRLLGKNDPA